ncbi:MAG: UPF0175 family protein [Candidatus Poribacteria bacterium]
MSSKKIAESKVLDMVRNKEVTLSKGAELLEMPLKDFLELASDNRISILDYEDDEVEQNLLALRKTFSKTGISK